RTRTTPASRASPVCRRARSTTPTSSRSTRRSTRTARTTTCTSAPRPTASSTPRPTSSGRHSARSTRDCAEHGDDRALAGHDRAQQMTEPARARRAAVLGSPIAHSLSPVLHRAAYRHLGLAGWRYDAFDVDETALPAFVEGLDDAWAGLS